jgi:hypothetical protein
MTRRRWGMGRGRRRWGIGRGRRRWGRRRSMSRRGWSRRVQGGRIWVAVRLSVFGKGFRTLSQFVSKKVQSSKEKYKETYKHGVAAVLEEL